MTTPAICSIANCIRSRAVRGWCRTHYSRWQKHGDPMFTLRPTWLMTPQERFWSHTQHAETGCIIWKGSTAGTYGAFRINGKNVRAHRFSYESTKGSIPPELELDHLCRVRLCVNPEHLEPVTRGENVRRGHAAHPRGTSDRPCPRGHIYTSNTFQIRRGKRECLICRRDSDRQRNKRRTEAHRLRRIQA